MIKLGEIKLNESFSQIQPTPKTFRDYLIFWGGQTISLLGSSIVGFALSWWITLEFLNETLISLTVFASIAPVVLLSPIAGVLADRFNKKVIIGVADTSQAVLTLVMILLFVFGLTNFWFLFSLLILRGICQGFHQPVVQSIIPIMVPEDKLSRINGVNFLFNGLINIVSQIIGAALWASPVITIEYILWIDVATFLIAVSVLFLIKIPKVQGKKSTETRQQSYFADFKEGLKTMKMIKGILTLTIVSLFLNFLITPLNALESFFIYDTHGGNEFNRAFLAATMGAGMIVGALITSVKKEWKHKVTWASVGIINLCFGLAIIGAAPYQWFWLIYLGGFVLIVLNPIINTLAITAIQKAVPPDKIGRVMSVLVGSVTAITPIGYLVSGPLAELLGVRQLFLISAIIGLMVITIGLGFGDFGLLRDEESPLKEETEENENNSL
jgi:DHA3 family macrolide efflux protein-like MFS transporter